MNRAKYLFPFAFLFLALGVVGRMDYENHITAEKYKCERLGKNWVNTNSDNIYCCR